MAHLNSPVPHPEVESQSHGVVSPTRQDMMPGSSGRRYARLIAEGAAILASVLFAFAIQAWWEGRRERAEDTRLLVAVVDEFRANLTAVEANRAFHRGVLAADTTVLRLAGTDVSAIEPAYADSLMADLSWWNGSTSWSTDAVEALIAAGRLSAIRDESLRRTLAGWESRVNQVRAAEDQEYDFFFSVFMPYIRREGSLPQLSDAIRARPGSTELYGIGRLNYAQDPTDHRRLLVSREFQNMALQQRWIQEDILEWYDKLYVTLENVIAGLESELAHRGAAGR